ncbi:MAG: hypothetical protein R2692_00410 [Microbacterium sp.]
MAALRPQNRQTRRRPAPAPPPFDEASADTIAGAETIDGTIERGGDSGTGHEHAGDDPGHRSCAELLPSARAGRGARTGPARAATRSAAGRSLRRPSRHPHHPRRHHRHH